MYVCIMNLVLSKEIRSTQSPEQSGDQVPWVPEDIFFLWTLMVRGDIIDKKKNPLEPRVHIKQPTGKMVGVQSTLGSVIRGVLRKESKRK